MAADSLQMFFEFWEYMVFSTVAPFAIRCAERTACISAWSIFGDHVGLVALIVGVRLMEEKMEMDVYLEV